LDDTLILFSSDNGYFLGEHGLSDKRAPYEASIRIPLLVRYPAWFPEPTLVRDNLALNLDIGRTLLDAAGLPPLPGMRGHSLRALAAGEARRESFLYLYQQDPDLNNERARCTPTLLALRTLTHKLVVYPDAGETSELYDLRADPMELRNRIDDGELYKTLMAQLRAAADSLGVTLLDAD
jgi:arylsulfatase A-like enzyme